MTNEEILSLAETCGFVDFMGEHDNDTDVVYYECLEEQLLKFARTIHEKGYNEGSVSEFQPSMTNCVINGNPPNGYVTWAEWYNELGSKGILHKLRISAIE